MQDRVFYSICFGFVLGVLLRSLIFVNIFIAVFLGVIGMALFLIFAFLSKAKWGLVFSIFILTFSFGIFRFHTVDISSPNVFESKVGNKVSFTGEIIDEPDKRENNQKLTIEVSEDGEKTKILASVNIGGDYKYGDEVKIEGKLQKPENFITDQGKEFDYVNYLRKDGVYYVMNYVNAEVVSQGHGNKIKIALFFVKEKFVEKINFAIQDPESLLMGGLILGEKSAFSEELRTNFVKTGTIHIVALSGYNVTIIAEWIMKLFSRSSSFLSFIPKNFGIGFGIFAIILFVLMTGASSTAIRAGIMAVLALIARATGRNYDVARALILAGVFMILFNPFVLVYDVSFQLSFIATVAVIFFTPRIEKYFFWVPIRFQLRDIVSVTSAAYIFVTPFILYKMGNLSLVALPANVLILPFIPFTMLLGFLTGFVGLLYYVFAVPFGYASYFLLHYELWIINFFANIPFAAFSVPNFPFILTLLIYMYFIYMLFGKSINKFFTEPL